MHLEDKEWSLEELIERCSRRPPDEAAWEEFVRRFNSVIRSSVIRTFRRKVDHEAERKSQFPDDLIDDLVQVVYARLVEDRNRALARFEGEFENSIFQYLSIISINVVLDHFRESKAKKRPKLAYSLDELQENSGDSPILKNAISPANAFEATPEENLIAKSEIDRAVKRAVSGKHKDRDIMIFKLRYYEGLTLEEIKKALGLDLSSVGIGSILNRVTSRLRHLLDPNKQRGRGKIGRGAKKGSGQ